MFPARGAVAAAWLLSSTTQSRAPSLDLEAMELANGLVVLVNAQPDNPSVHVEVTYRVGSRDDPPGKEGLAHLLEHVMWSGTRHIRDGQLVPLLEMTGARLDAATTADFTTFSTTLPASELELALWVESSRMGFLLGRLGLGHALEREKASIARERRWVTPAEAGMLEAALAQLYPAGHRYRHLPTGQPERLAGIALDDVRQFYARHFGPNHAVVVLSGGVPARGLRALLDKYFGPLVRGPEPANASAVAELALPRAGQPSLVTVAATDEQSRVLLVWPSVAAFSEQEPAAEVLACLLAGAPDARLDQALGGPSPRIRHAAARQVGLAVDGRFEVALTPSRGQDPDKISQAALAAIEALAASPPDEAEVARARARCRRNQLLGLQAPWGLARHLGRRQLQLGTTDGFADGFARLDAVDAAAVARAAKTLFGNDRVVVIARPGATAAAPSAASRGLASRGASR